MNPVYIEIDKFGDKYFYKDKKMTIFHREDGPAIECSNGDKAWFINGSLHREDGPAIEYACAAKVWYLDGVKYTEEEFKMKTAKKIVLTMNQIADKFGVEVEKIKIKK
jgi:hypothetical protein